MQFKYQSRHIPSGSIIEKTGYFISENEFLRYLNTWNITGCGNYIFTATDMFPKHGTDSRYGKDTETVIREPIRDMNKVVEDGGFWFDCTVRSESK